MDHRGRRYVSDVARWDLVKFLLTEMLAGPQTPAAVAPIIQALFPLTMWHRWRLHAAGAKDRQEFARQLRLAACLEFPAPPPPRFEYRITLDGQTWRSLPVTTAYVSYFRKQIAVTRVSDQRPSIFHVFPPRIRYLGLWARLRSHRLQILDQLEAGPHPLQEAPR